MSDVIRDLVEVNESNPVSAFSPEKSDPNAFVVHVEGQSADRESETAANAVWNRTKSVVRKRIWFVLFVVVPTLLSAIYYFTIASDQYVSEARFVIKAPNQRSAPVTSLASLIQTTGMSFGIEQTKEVLDYLNSRAAVDDLSKNVAVKAMFEHQGADFLSRYPKLWRDDRFENLFSYYQDMVDASIDPDTNIAVVKVRAFTAQDSYKINEGLLQLSEAMVNRLSERAQTRAVSDAEKRVAAAEGRLRKARLAMSRYRQSENLVDPTKQASSILDISDRLIVEQTSLQAQLELMIRVAPQNPSIPAIRRRIEAIGRALASQYGRAVGNAGALVEKLPGYEQVGVEQEMAKQNYELASASLEQARLEAQRQQFYLERISSPRIPDLSQYPHRFRTVLTIAFASLCVYFVGWMLVIGILEHAPED